MNIVNPVPKSALARERVNGYFFCNVTRSQQMHSTSCLKYCSLLRVAAVMHVLFNMDKPQIPEEISEHAIKAAKSFVDLCPSAYLGGKGDLYISVLLASKRFRDKGNKDGAVRAIKMLERARIGRMLEDKPP